MKKNKTLLMLIIKKKMKKIFKYLVFYILKTTKIFIKIDPFLIMKKNRTLLMLIIKKKMKRIFKYLVFLNYLFHLIEHPILEI